MEKAEQPVRVDETGRTVSDGREMLGKAVHHRFNFFSVLVPVLATSIVQYDSLPALKSAPGAGLGLSLVFLFTLWKNQGRLNAALDILVRHKDHPVAALDKVLGPDSAKGAIGIVIPLIWALFLLIGNTEVRIFAPGICGDISR